MKISVVCAFIASVATSGAAVAGCADAQSHLSLTNLRTLLGSHYVCGRSSALNPPGWNELHNGTTGGSLVEQHEGSSTVETVGTWSTANVASNGRVTYSYSGGVTPIYEVAAVADVNCQPAGNCTTLNTVYQFCGVGGGAPAVLNIYISASFQAPTPSGSGFTMNTNCPVNP